MGQTERSSIKKGGVVYNPSKGKPFPYDDSTNALTDRISDNIVKQIKKKRLFKLENIYYNYNIIMFVVMMIKISDVNKMEI